ncbi:hypothetical protein PT2222_190145 [Paraburkholderia tropica]
MFTSMRAQPSLASWRSASRTGMALTEKCRAIASCRSGAFGASVPSTMAVRKASAIMREVLVRGAASVGNPFADPSVALPSRGKPFVASLMRSNIIYKTTRAKASQTRKTRNTE